MQKLKSSLNESLNERLQAKYPHLELAVLPLSQVNKDNESKRIDSEYFKKEYLENEKIISNHFKILGEISAKICNGSTPTNGEFENSGIPFYRSQDFDLLDTEPKQYVTIDFHNSLLRSKVKYRDILVAIIGATLGKIGFVRKDIMEANINQNIAKISIIDKDFNPYFIATFLDSYYGQYQIFRLATQTAQEYLNNIQVSKIKIPILPKDFQLEIEKLVKDSHKALEDSKALYKEAENLLCESLGLDSTNPLESLLIPISSLRGSEADEAIHKLKMDCHADKSARNDENSPLFVSGQSSSPSLSTSGARGWVNTHNDDIIAKYQHLNISIRQLSQSYGKSGRIDSKYYQSKYDAIERTIKDYKGGCCKLESSEIKDTNFIPKTQEKYRYIELANIGNNGNISEPLEDLGANLPTRARRKVKTGDFIMSSIEGSLASCAIITPEFDGCLVSTGFYVLNSTKLNSETLLVLFKSAFFQEFLKKFPSGTILTAISKDKLLNVLIPKIDFTTQEQIASKIQKSFALRKVAKDLLESAKFKVECAIDSK